MSQTAKKKEERIDLRVNDEAKDLIERAASITGMSVSAFTLSNTLRAAREELTAFEKITLSDQDRDLFLTKMANPPKANEALRTAMKKFKKNYR